MTVPTFARETRPPPSSKRDLPPLHGGVVFLDAMASGRMDLLGLCQWLDEYVVEPGCMLRTASVVEPQAGSVALWSTGEALEVARASLPRVLHTARERVVSTLSGFVATPRSDRFVYTSMFTGRVRREGGRWEARPEQAAPLSVIVISLFAAAILSDRKLHDRELCVCATCGRVSFHPSPSKRTGCPEHAARGRGAEGSFG